MLKFIHRSQILWAQKSAYFVLIISTVLYSDELRVLDQSEDQGVDGRMGSKWILRRLAGGCVVDSPGSG
jgi:hypothetical protein